MNVSTSLICCDLSNPSNDLDNIVINKGFNWLHADFMDGHFVPRYGISPELIQCLRKRYGSSVIIDSHLMVSDPFTYANVIAPYSDWFFFHYEATSDPVRTLQMLRKTYPTLKIGLTFNVFTPDCVIYDIIRHNEQLIDGVMFMGISPGVLGTSSFAETVTRRLKLVQNEQPYLKTFVDGSVNFQTVKDYKEAGAYTVVSGSSMMFNKCTENQFMSREQLINYNIIKINSIIADE